MMDHPIALAIPSKIERFGVCYHGLFLARTNEDGEYTFQDVEIITRAGRIIKPKAYEQYPEVYSARGLPRPVLYMHPKASHDVESEDGVDRSGYCIFYQDTGSYTRPSFLRGRSLSVRLAYTPDSLGQGVVFRLEHIYMSPLEVNKPINTGGEISLPVQSIMIGKVLSVTPDGRIRVKGRFPDISGIFYMWYWFGRDWEDQYKPFIESYSLSGESGSIFATPVAVAQPEYSYDTDSQADVGERVVRVSVLVPSVGVCTDPSIWDATAEIIREPMPLSPDYSRSYEKMTSDIDACADALSPTFLSCSVEIESVVTNSDDADGGGTISWGAEQCGIRSDDDRLCIGTSDFVNTSRTSTLLESESISLTGWGGSSSGIAEYRSSLKSAFSRSRVDRIEVSRTETNDFESSIIVTLDGQAMMSKQNWPAVSSSEGPRYSLPRAIQGAEGDVRLSFPHSDHEAGSIEAGVNFSRAAFYKMSLSADGVHAIACLVTEGTVVFLPGVGLTLDPDTINHRLVIGRIFGFGISVPGREITEAEMNSQLFIAYDPLEKKFSDIYTHPVYFQ